MDDGWIILAEVELVNCWMLTKCAEDQTLTGTLDGPGCDLWWDLGWALLGGNTQGQSIRLMYTGFQWLSS